jgi:hypothetical protein
MVKYIKILSVVLLLSAIVFSGCSDRGPNIPTATSLPHWGISPKLFVFADTLLTTSPQLIFQIRNPFGIMKTAIYVPKVGWPPPDGEGRPLPLLILLAPQDGDEYFYFEHGLQELADEMVASGEIEPMVICCVSNDQVFGGYFYGNSYPAGFYDAIIGSQENYRLLSYLYTDFPFIIDSASKRGIGGIGQGAYGAFRACIKHPGVFSSISVVDGPLDFDGSTDNNGLIDLFDDALMEQGLLNADSIGYKFDSSSAWPISRLFIGGSLAFSPHDTSITYYFTWPFGHNNPPLINVTARDTIADTKTLVTNVIKDIEAYKKLDFHLPFDSTGAKYDLIWNLWLKNNLDSLYEEAGGSPLTGLNMWIATSPQAYRNFHDMTLSWIDFLFDHGYTPDTLTYNGYPGKPAAKNEYIYDLMRQMLLFHNNNFGN